MAVARKELGQDVWRDDKATGYIMLDITDHIIPLKSMKINSQTLLPKSEYHCTLVATPKVVQNKAQQAQVFKIVSQFIENNTLSFRSLNSQLFVCRKNGEITIIARCEVVGLLDLQQQISRQFPHYRPPFPHVTLLKSENSRYGIGVNYDFDFKELCQKL